MKNQPVGTSRLTPGRRLSIGIDVGGTNTDAVLYDNLTGSVVAAVKLPTVHFDYERPIADAVRLLLQRPDIRREDILSVNISTTLSTNAVLENKTAPVNLALIGFEKYPHIYSEIISHIKPAAIISISGGHTVWGKEKEPLDEAALAEFAAVHRGELFAVSSMYSTRNPEHETAAGNILTNAGCAGVTCGHELARSKLNALKRTLTAYLNSSLIPLTERLISGIERAAADNSLSAPIMFLRSDSSLVSSEWCRRFPIETVFSGPAASVRGARKLFNGSVSQALVIADMGGTSTDIGAIVDGRAVSADDGAVIGGYRTMIPSLDITTIALGGDSRVRADENGEVTVGPQRALPLCRACGHTLYAREKFEKLLDEASAARRPPEFILLSQDAGKSLVSGAGKKLAAILEDGAMFAGDVTPALIKSGLTEAEAADTLKDAVRLGAVYECAFTPTDALNALSLAEIGTPEYSRAAEEIFAKTGCPDAASKVCSHVRAKLESAMREKAESLPKAVRVCVGAPIKAFAPRSAEGILSVTPKNKAVAGAVGAATSSLELTCSVSVVRSFSDDTFTAFLPTETISSADIGELLPRAEKALKNHLTEQARQMGYEDTLAECEKKSTYLGKARTLAALSTVVLEGRLIVRNAQ